MYENIVNEQKEGEDESNKKHPCHSNLNQTGPVPQERTLEEDLISTYKPI